MFSGNGVYSSNKVDYAKKVGTAFVGLTAYRYVRNGKFDVPTLIANLIVSVAVVTVFHR